MHMLDDLYDLCETLEHDLAKTNEKLRMAGGEMSGADLEYVDKLTHSIKSIKTTIAMIEADDNDDGYSGYDYRVRPASYARGGTRRGSGTRKRDSMGRYSRDGGFRAMLEEAAERAPDEQTRTKLRRMISEM